MELMWAFVVIGGPILFAIFMLTMKLMNKRTLAQKQRTEEAVRRRREEAAHDREAGESL